MKRKCCSGGTQKGRHGDHRGAESEERFGGNGGGRSRHGCNCVMVEAVWRSEYVSFDVLFMMQLCKR